MIYITHCFEVIVGVEYNYIFYSAQMNFPTSKKLNTVYKIRPIWMQLNNKKTQKCAVSCYIWIGLSF